MVKGCGKGRWMREKGEVEEALGTMMIICFLVPCIHYIHPSVLFSYINKNSSNQTTFIRNSSKKKKESITQRVGQLVSKFRRC